MEKKDKRGSTKALCQNPMCNREIPDGEKFCHNEHCEYQPQELNLSSQIISTEEICKHGFQYGSAGSSCDCKRPTEKSIREWKERLYKFTKDWREPQWMILQLQDFISQEITSLLTNLQKDTCTACSNMIELKYGKSFKEPQG